MKAKDLLARLQLIVQAGYGDLDVYMDENGSDSVDNVDVITKDSCGYPYVQIHNVPEDYSDIKEDL